MKNMPRNPDGTFPTKLWCDIHNCERLRCISPRSGRVTQTYCRACNRDKTAAWRRTEKGKAYVTAYSERNRDEINRKTLEWYRANKALCNARARRNHDALRGRVFAALGNKCFCCGETTTEFLTIDHINGGGRKHRNSGRKAGFHTRDVYADIEREGYPKDKYRLACWNCNCALGKYGYCPHQKKSEEPPIEMAAT